MVLHVKTRFRNPPEDPDTVIWPTIVSLTLAVQIVNMILKPSKVLYGLRSHGLMEAAGWSYLVWLVLA